MYIRKMRTKKEVEEMLARLQLRRLELSQLPKKQRDPALEVGLKAMATVTRWVLGIEFDDDGEEVHT